MRPHVELIQQADLCWHSAELPRGDGKAVQRNLCYDEENGAASIKMRFDSAWNRPAGYHHADTEWFVMSGELRLGDRTLTDGGYFRAPAGLRIPALSVKEGSEVLLFREYGDWGFSDSDKHRDGFVSRGANTASSEPGELSIVETAGMDWTSKADEGFSSEDEKGQIQQQLCHKWLFRDPAPEGDPTRGFGSFLCWAPPGWSDHQLMHHPVFEEAYTLDGNMDYNFGRLLEGTYFFRPANVKHGHFHAGEEKGVVFLIRVDGQLINWATVNSEVIVKGDAVNYDPKEHPPVMAGLPLRSKSTGPWDLKGW